MLNRLDRTQQLISRTTRYPCKRAFTPNRPRRTLLLRIRARSYGAAVPVKSCSSHPQTLADPAPSARPSSARTQEPPATAFGAHRRTLHHPLVCPPLAPVNSVQARSVPPAGVLLSLASLCLRHEGGATSPDYPAPSGWGSSDTAASAWNLLQTTIRARVQEKRSPHADRMHFRRPICGTA
ncbi:hypothetical protein C6P46_006726 [Rhodotorula mucilaginosa]|uniref:Uncharacterized protein n=1 Tax=Rhodotorula mucilaginosa TaxID=5537 RepID=A0A9P6VXQ6_RHOMI|nr:hypothetical protein C6P46_006726 [Rhodotorula mucilaginosa]